MDLLNEIIIILQGGVPWCIMFADDIILVQNREEVNNRLDEDH